jgi:hypothetical protein
MNISALGFVGEHFLSGVSLGVVELLGTASETLMCMLFSSRDPSKIHSLIQSMGPGKFADKTHAAGP